MTEEQRDILIAKMLDAPSSLSDYELDMIEHDDELREIHETSAAISGACIRQPELDMDSEWERFRPRIRRKPSAIRRVMRVAAIFLGIMLVSSLLVKMVDHTLTSGKPAALAKVEHPAPLDLPASPEAVIPSPAVDDHTDAIKASAPGQARPAVPRKARATLAKAKAPATPATSSPADLDIDEYLRIQQARIDNELAMQVAETVVDEFEAIRLLYDTIGEDDESMVNALREITMQ